MNQIIIEIIRRKKALLVLVLALILANIALMVVVSFQEPELTASRSKWSELRGLVARTGHVDTATMYQQGIKDLEKLDSRIPPKREFGRVLSELIETASDNGVVSGPLSYKPLSIKDESILTYQLTYSVSGDYASTKSYLSDLLQNRELVVVDSVSMSNGDSMTENVVMNLNVTVYLREGA